MIEILVWIVSTLVGVFFLHLTVRSLNNKHEAYASFFAMTGAIFIFCGFPWVQGFIKTGLVSYVNAAVQGLGNQLEVTQTTLSNQIYTVQSTLSNHVQSVQETTKVMHAQLDSHQVRITEAQAKIANSQTELDLQQSKIAHVEQLIENVYSAIEFDIMGGSDTNKIIPIQAQNMALVRLSYVPMPKSVTGLLQNSLMQIPLAGVVFQFRNIVGFRFNGNWNSNYWRDSRFVFQYSADKRHTNLIKQINVTGDGTILFDGTEAQIRP